ncbi:MAG: flagellar cap protein FliD N-terminal domain-containing protein [Candidatus Kapabacteria bacterium]|jgi:flagellar hook-associated protein 2|nr:flagellar cap protein FliD N-terminal domain-containing protein [Candidatus Kapabacteria bacterium]
MSLNSVLGSEQSQTDLLVESFKSTQQGKITSLNERRNLLQSRQSFYNTFNSRISSLVSQIDKFTADDSNSKFYAKSIESSDSSIVSASANSKAIISENTIKVKQLASNDTLISKRMNLADNFGEDAGTITFDLTAGTNTKQVSVTFDGTETNEQALKKIVQAINNTYDIYINSSNFKYTIKICIIYLI